MNRVISVGEVAEAGRTLRGTAARLQELAGKLEKEREQGKAALLKDLENRLLRLRGETAAEREKKTSEQQEHRSHFEKKREQRRARVSEAHASARKKGLAQVEQAEGRRTFAGQKGILETERARETRLAGIDRDYEAFQRATDQERANLGALRNKARNAFGGYWFFRRFLNDQSPMSLAGEDRDPNGLLDQVRALEAKSWSELKRFRARILPDLFRFLPIWLWIVILAGLGIAGSTRLGLSTDELEFRKILGVAAAVMAVLYFAGMRLSRGPALSASKALKQAEHTLEEAANAGFQRHGADLEQAKADASHRVAAFRSEWDSAVAEATDARGELDQRLKAKYQRALDRNEKAHASLLARLDHNLTTTTTAGDAEQESASSRLRADTERKLQALEAEFTTQRADLEKQWKQALDPVADRFAAARDFARDHFSAWAVASSYHPPESALNTVKFGELEIRLPGILPRDATQAPAHLRAPLALVLPEQGSVLLESDGPGREAAVDCLNNIVYRILQSIPPGKASFTLIDPVRLGESFSSIMHLADFEENMVNRRIWTSTAEIEERLLELNVHMEKVIQMYLRNEFKDIVEYNKEAGRIAEKYHFLVVADFPSNFSETAMRRLIKIAASGARCGVFMLIHLEKRQMFPPGFDPSEIVRSSAHFQVTRSGVVLPELGGAGVSIQLDAPPAAELATEFLQAVGKASRGSNTVQVPFAQIAPGAEDRWSHDTTEELRVPIGRTGATKLQYLSLGKGTRQHVLIAGKTGSGKSTLLHVLVTNLALWSSPEQVEFYLVDFKKGVEFKDYAVSKLPHARVIAIESDREFGLSVLRRVDEELRVRGELFRAAGAQDLAGYKRASNHRRMPRVLLIIDEFQELFVEDDSMAQNAALLLDRIVRQGRAFGIHVVLGSQTLGGAYSLARSTLGQMAIRIALQCNEADAYLIMDENNPAPRLLSRPGEGIYNDSGGMIEANSPFQVVWLPETERREALEVIGDLAEKNTERNEPIVFEGNIPADLGENAELNALLDVPSSRRAGGAVIWLGLPNEIKGPTRVILEDRSGKNLLIAGQHEDHARALLAASMLALAAQNAPGQARFVLLESASPEDSARFSLTRLAARLPVKVDLTKPGDIPEMLRRLTAELERREGGEQGARIFLLIHNLSAYKALRPEDEYSLSYEEGKSSAAADFQKIYTEGPVHGIHVIAHVDGFNNASRFLGRRGLKEFSLRVLFQMSASDSASFCDDARAGHLGLSRALLYDELEGAYETFRPYARPGAGWLAEAEEKLSASGPRLDIDSPTTIPG